MRECREELGVEIEVAGLAEQAGYTYPENEVTVTFFEARINSGIPQKRVHQKILWVQPSALPQYDFCPADTEIINRLAGE
ncbi:MAG: hypothetical protein LUC29_08150 [Acidaminococcaceae bacterium]|nr:hypothetical protein [Acidaminococcaceae bacterium]